MGDMFKPVPNSTMVSRLLPQSYLGFGFGCELGMPRKSLSANCLSGESGAALDLSVDPLKPAFSGIHLAIIPPEPLDRGDWDGTY